MSINFSSVSSKTSSNDFDFDFAWCHGFVTLKSEIYQYRYCGYRAKGI
jgi:hypothetical protein